MARSEKTSGVTLKPPFVLYSGLTTGGLFQFFLPVKIIFFTDTRVQISIATTLFLASMLIMTMAVFSFKKMGTNIRPDRPATALVTKGIFKLTRNPMYLSFCLLGIAFTVYFNSAWLLAGTLPFCIYIHHMVIPAEENYMIQTFGEEYIKYTEKTRRWL